MTRKKKKTKKQLDQLCQETFGMSIQELAKLKWVKKFPLPSTFRGKMDNKEYMFEVKGRDEFYITIPDLSSNEPVPKEEGHKLLQIILEQQENISAVQFLNDNKRQ